MCINRLSFSMGVVLWVWFVHLLRMAYSAMNLNTSCFFVSLSLLSIE